MLLEFEWDPRKASANARKHGIGFEEAATAFGDPRSITIPDPGHSMDEERYILLKRSDRGRLLVAAHLDRGSRIRLISARTATRRERQSYEEEVI